MAPYNTEWANLLEAARTGDDDAFGKICNQMSEYLLLTANDIGQGLTAKFGPSDIVQQVLLEARQGIGSFNGTSEREFRVWLTRLVQHNLIDASRKYRNTEKRDTLRERSINTGKLADRYEGTEKTASSIMSRGEIDNELLQALAQLPDRRRSIIELRHWQGMGFAEIGRELNISEGAARKLLERALEELRMSLPVDHVNR